LMTNAPLIRPPACAGTFYPADPAALRSAVEGYLSESAWGDSPPKAIIAPHAGYVYSGASAATAYRTLASARDRISRVVMIGPAHRTRVEGLAASGADAFATPLGNVPVDRQAVGEILQLPCARIVDEAHREEHCLEVQLPFLQVTLGEFSIVPLLAGAVAAEQVAEALERLWGGPETLILISSDLSHFHDDPTAQAMDQAAAQAIAALEPGDLDREQACGRLPIQGLLAVAQERGMRADVLDLRNSSKASGDRKRVVGYGAFAFQETD
ncbi:MAG: AmmeMemoRadiSam system protein B, partial [Planctomycetales bacterium]